MRAAGTAACVIALVLVIMAMCLTRTEHYQSDRSPERQSDVITSGFETRADAAALAVPGDSHQYKADAGFVHTLELHDGETVVLPHQKCDPEVQKALFAALLAEFGKDMGCDDAECVARYVDREWPDGDAMYVLTVSGAFVGCVAVDRKNFVPFLSHLYVVPKHRGRGNGLLLLEFAERACKDMGFTEARLWCDPGMRAYYEKYGWTPEKVKGGKLVMKKVIDDAAPQGSELMGHFRHAKGDAF